MNTKTSTAQPARERPCFQRMLLSTGLIVQAGGAIMAIGVIAMALVR
jgi:hypothetical protein